MRNKRTYQGSILDLQRSLGASVISEGIEKAEAKPEGTIVPLSGNDQKRLRKLGETFALAWKGAELCGEVSGNRFSENPPIWPEHGVSIAVQLQWRKVIKGRLGDDFERVVPETIQTLRKLVDGDPLDQAELEFTRGPLMDFLDGRRATEASTA